jgi:hypothetical protein
MKNINWTRIFTTVNFVALLYVLWCIFDLYRLNSELGAALIFWTDVSMKAFHQILGKINLFHF